MKKTLGLAVQALAVAAASTLRLPLTPSTPAIARCSQVVAKVQSQKEARKQLYTFDLKKIRQSDEVDVMLAAHHPKNLKEYSMGISAYGRSKDWRKALLLLDEMLKAGITPDVVSFSAQYLPAPRADGGRWRFSCSNR